MMYRAVALCKNRQKIILKIQERPRAKLFDCFTNKVLIYILYLRLGRATVQ